MPNPHYQRVLQQDQALPAPLRWLSRAMSSWWTILVLGGYVVGYVAAAHVPIGGRYVWQWRIFDTTQHAVLTWWPLLAAAWLLAGVILWSAMRRLPWRIDNLGAFIAVLGVSIILVSQSWAFRSQTIGIAAVPITESTGNTQADALSLNYTTRYGDTHERVLVVMVGGAAPITIPLDGLPRWNDATGQAMPTLKLHDHPKIASIIGFSTRITTAAYLADGTLAETADGTQTATRNEGLDRSPNTLPYPVNALLALEITTDLEDGNSKTTTAWLPFEPEGADALVPKHFFEIEGLGSVGLAFRPASKKLPFALGYQADQSRDVGWLFAADSNDNRLVQPTKFSLLDTLATPAQYKASAEGGQYKTFEMQWTNSSEASVFTHCAVEIRSGQSNPFILAGLITFVLGVLVDRGLVFLTSPKKTSSQPPAESPSKGPSPIPNAKP